MSKLLIYALLACSFLISCSNDPKNVKPQTFQNEKPAQNANVIETPEYTVKVIRQFEHNIYSYTQGLFLDNGFLYESTGLKGQSTLQKIDLMSGKVLSTKYIGDNYFGEGIAKHKDKIYQLTWMDGTCFVYDANSLSEQRSFSYFGEGWGLASDGDKFFMSDGSFVLKIVDPASFATTGNKMIYYLDGRPTYDMNELEFANGFLWANIWQKDLIAKIDTAQSKVVGLVDITPLRDIVKQINPRSEVSNGIAYNPKTNTFYLTGKYWPLVFEVEIIEKK